MEPLALLEELLVHPVGTLFLIVAIGTALGRIRLAKISLGNSGVLFAGLVAGHLGLNLPSELQELGIILFVYSIGLQAGPRFFNQFRHRGIMFAKIALIVVGTGAATTLLLTRLLSVDPAIAIGMYAGAMTSTPGLAAATDSAMNPTVSVGFGVAYPVGVIGVVLLVQLLPRLMRIDLSKEEDRLGQKEAKQKRLERRQFQVSNPACVGRSLSELNIRQMSEVTVTRVSRGGAVQPARPDLRLQLDDVVLAVGRSEELEKLKILFGREVHGEDIFKTIDVVARDVLVSNDEMAGRTLADLMVLRRYGVVISRVFREDLDFVPTGNYSLEIGDMIRVTGGRQECEKFVAEVGQKEKRIYETSMAALSLGIVLGVLLAYKDFSLPIVGSFRLGLAGGPLLVSLVLAHFGRIGRLNIRIPRGAKYIMQQLGLVLFLAGAGTAAGSSIGSVLVDSGAGILLSAALVTISSVAAGFLVTYYLYRQDFLTVLGAICGAMTSTPALGVITEASDRSEPVLAYTAVYPVALIVITVLCQLLYFLL